ncbi:MAG: c-type cytochrome, partial [Anaerolineales bacterium]|nr:c-type cytochrome [Anaerolineales bacterium]
WYVPLLKTKKGGPWWCVPDPEPGVNQCEAILRFLPGDAPEQFTAEEMAAIPTPTITPTPAATNTPAPTATPRAIEGQTAEEVILNAGCGACHAIGSLGEAHKVGPDLSAIGITAGDRVPDLTAAEYLRQSILEPNAFIAPDCPNGPCIPNIMPRDYGTRLLPEQVDLIVAYLLTQEGAAESLPVIGADTDATVLPKAVPAKQAVPQSGYTPSVTALSVQLLLLLMVFVLTLFMLVKRPSS